MDVMTPKERRARRRWYIEHVHPDEIEELKQIEAKKKLNAIVAKQIRRNKYRRNKREEAYEWDMVAPWVDKLRGNTDHQDIPGW